LSLPTWSRAGMLRLFGNPFRQVRDLMQKVCRKNPGWGAPHIHGELLKLGIDIGESSVSKYMVRCRKPPSQTWCT
jgi:putative transposase